MPSSCSAAFVAPGTPPIIIRADSGSENHKQFKTLEPQCVEFSIAVKQSKTIRALIEQIPDTDWVTIEDYPDTGEASTQTRTTTKLNTTTTSSPSQPHHPDRPSADRH